MDELAQAHSMSMRADSAPDLSGNTFANSKGALYKINGAVAEYAGQVEPDAVAAEGEPTLSNEQLRARIAEMMAPSTDNTLVQQARSMTPDTSDQITEDALILDKNFIAASRDIYEMFEGKQFTGTADEAVQYGLDTMGEFSFNFFGVPGVQLAETESGFAGGGTLAQAATIIASGDPGQAQSFLYAMGQYERLPNFTKAGMARVFRGLVNDPANVMGIASGGLPFVLKQIGQDTAAMGVRKALQSLAKNPVKYSAAAGGAYSSGFEAATMDIERASGRDISAGEELARFGISTGIGTAAGATIGKVAEKVLPAVGDAVSAIGKPAINAAGDFIEAAGEQAQKQLAETGPKIMSGPDLDTPINQIVAAAGDAVKALRAKGTEYKNVTDVEVDRITKSASSEEDVQVAAQKADTDIARFPETDGWVRPEVLDPVGKTPSFTKDDKGNVTVNYKPVAYAFNKPPQSIDETAHQKNLTDKTVNEVIALVARAKSGDKKARKIIQEANWYRAMRTKLRQQYGGLGDVFADLLGATSANTGVQVNYENALIALKKFTNGDYDDALKEYEAMINRGESMSAKNIYAADKDPKNPFNLIRKDSGKLLGMNSAPAMGALLDLFRNVKAGKSPKTVNFTGNLIGYSRDATIDVWAARWLRRAAGLPRIATVSEQGVTGAHGAKSTMESPVVGGEFGFGQKVFASAANEINKKGILTNYKKSIGNVGNDDLQAVVWFMEKEEWTSNGWTSKAGEGGSFDYEAKFTGQADQKRVKELRSIAVSDVTTKEEKIAARKELKTLMSEPERYQAGVAMERPDQVPTNQQQADLAQEVTAPLKNNKDVIAHNAVNSLGEFAGELERSLNYEVITKKNFDDTQAVNALVAAGRKYDQDAVFWSKVVNPETANARPGAEIYFMKRQGVDYAQQITAVLRKNGVDGFTFITDARLKDQPRSQSTSGETTGGLTGIRFQYIPEFDDSFTPNNATQRFREMEKIFKKAMRDIGKISGISYADVVHYDTKVFKNTDRQGAEWINGGQSYSEILD